MSDVKQSTAWLKSNAAKKALRINSCDLMHHRLAGKLRFRKEGHSFLYRAEDLQKLKSESKRKH
jgi:hypothetical protein